MIDMLLIAGWCFAASLVLPLFAWALMPLLPRSAATRHLVWLALFAVLLALPFLTLVVPPEIVMQRSVAAASPAPMTAPAPQGLQLADAIWLLILAWLAGILFHLARLGLGLFGLYRLCRSSAPFDGARDVCLADDGPLAFGLFRPMILLPRDADNWPLARLVAVLAHERAHLARHDSLTQLLAQLVCAVYWPNPVLWLAARAMRHQAEIAADNAVLAAGVRPSDYAAELLQLAGRKLRLPAPAMAAPSLEARVKSVLSPDLSRRGVRALDVFKIAWLGCAAALALAFARPAIAEVQSQILPPPAAGPHATAEAPAAPVPAAAPVAAAPPAPLPIRHHHRVIVRGHGNAMVTEHSDAIVTENGSALTAEDKARIDQAMVRVRVAMAGIRPQIDRALQQARANRAAAQSVQQAMPQVHAAIAQALAQIRPVIHQAFVDARVDVKVSVVLNRAQEQIDRAVAHAERDAERDAAHAQHDAEREAARAARAKVHGQEENPDPGDTDP